jgi:hypothetical protein
MMEVSDYRLLAIGSQYWGMSEFASQPQICEAALSVQFSAIGTPDGLVERIGGSGD